jgi:hypothetical protein
VEQFFGGDLSRAGSALKEASPKKSISSVVVFCPVNTYIGRPLNCKKVT